MSKVLYRYEIRYTNYDDGETGIRLLELPVIRETERTYFIERRGVGSYLKRVSKDGDDFGYNAYAYSDKENAKANFIRRTKKRVSWYKFWIKECETALELIKSEDKS